MRMSFARSADPLPAARLLQRSLERKRVGHAYLFAGPALRPLEEAALTLAKTLNCEQPTRGEASGGPIDSCDQCPVCRAIDQGVYADVHWLRPESKTRIITVEQTRDLMAEIQLKPGGARVKFGIIAGADRMNAQAANAFLKTLEEPPPRSILTLLSTDPQRLLDTVVSRCLRLNFGGEIGPDFSGEQAAWLTAFGETAASGPPSLMGRYRLMGSLAARLTQLKAGIESDLGARSPMDRYEDVDPAVRERWEDELAAATEAEYRRQRSELVAGLHWWFRDIWFQTLALPAELLRFPGLKKASEAIARRISSREARENLDVLDQTQRMLHTNVQEALALEVGLLKLKL
jgi:DNA polymerase III subunit delta'